MGKPEEIGAAVVWLCSDAAAFVIGHAWSSMAAKPCSQPCAGGGAPIGTLIFRSDHHVRDYLPIGDMVKHQLCNIRGYALASGDRPKRRRSDPAPS
jgi:hypothetical protein